MRQAFHSFIPSMCPEEVSARHTGIWDGPKTMKRF